MIYVKLNGRLGNYLFQIAAGASLAHQSDSECQVIIAPDSEPISVASNETMSSYLRQFQSTIFRNIRFTHQAPVDVPEYTWFEFRYRPLPNEASDLILHGYFQSYRYIQADVIQRLYAVPPTIERSLYEKYGTWMKRPFVCIHVRRGDYLKLPHRFSICSKKYFRTAMRRFGPQQLFVVISDDIEWCKRHLKGENIVYADQNSSILEDLYLQTFAQGNIISNSSFSWWGAYLNPHPDKQVYYPVPWFGPHNSHHDTSDLCPPSWTAIPNRTPFFYWLKSVFIRLKMKFE